MTAASAALAGGGGCPPGHQTARDAPVAARRFTGTTKLED